MKKINFYFNLGFEFLSKYCVQYFKALLLPLVYILIGILFVVLTLLNPLFGFLAIIIGVPCICFAFWRGYVATYALNFIAYDFYKKNQMLDFKSYIEKVNKKELAKYLGFCAIIILICNIPALFYAFKTIDFVAIFLNPFSVMSNPEPLLSAFGVLVLNNIFLLPFLNFYNQALFFKKENETYLTLFLNCYKLLNKHGIILSIIFAIFGGIIASLHPLIYGFLALLLNLITFSINTFWYSERCQKEI